MVAATELNLARGRSLASKQNRGGRRGGTRYCEGEVTAIPNIGNGIGSICCGDGIIWLVSKDELPEFPNCDDEDANAMQGQ